MAKSSMNDLLKRRMAATQQASELEMGNNAYEALFHPKQPVTPSKFCELLICKLRPFFTADIGFHPYPPEKLKAFAQQLSEQGIYERIIVRPIPASDEYEIRKAIKMTYLVPPLQDILENNPKRLNLACAELIADYDTVSQEAFVEICSIEGYQLNKAAMKHIVSKCPPPTAERHPVFAAWREARAAAEKRLGQPSKKISFDRKKFAPYLDKLGGFDELEELFLEFLQSRID